VLNVGAPELVIIAVVLVSIAVPVWALVDAAQRPDTAFRAAGQSKTLWIVLSALGLVVPVLGPVLPVVYLLAIRPQVRAAQVAVPAGSGG
jgi:hypothetical protein